jgi:hypothetical protein
MNKTKKIKKNKTYKPNIRGGTKNKSRPKSKPKSNIIKGISRPKSLKKRKKEQEKKLLGYLSQQINKKNEEEEENEEEENEEEEEEEENEEELCDLFKSEIEQFNISERMHHFNIIPNIFYVILQLNNIEFTDPEFKLIFLSESGQNPDFDTANAISQGVVEPNFTNIAAADAAARTLSAFSAAASQTAAVHTRAPKIVYTAFIASSANDIAAFEYIKTQFNTPTFSDQLQSLFDYYIFENVEELSEGVSRITTQIFDSFRQTIVYIDPRDISADKTKVSAESYAVQAYSSELSRALDVGIGNPHALEIITRATAIRAQDAAQSASTNNFIVNSKQVINAAERSFVDSGRIVAELTAQADGIRHASTVTAESIETISDSITESNAVFVANREVVVDLLSKGAGNAASRGDALAISALASPISNIADATAILLNDYNAIQSIQNGIENDFTLLNDEYIEYLYYYFKANNLDHKCLYRLIPIIIIGFLFSCDRDHIKTSLYINYDFTVLDGPFPSLNEFTLTIYLIILKTIGIGGRLNTIQNKIILMLICKRLNFV